MYVNPTMHVNTPEHVLLTKDEDNELVKALVPCAGDVHTAMERQAAKTKLPKMPTYDIIRKWYGFPSGGIVMLSCNYAVLQGAERSSLKYRVIQ